MDKTFQNQKYLNLETIRKSGVAVNTPVWFVQDGEVLYVMTGANSGKVKRIRNKRDVRIAPCKMDGRLIGEWNHAFARELIDPDITRKVDQLLDKKYGLLKKLFFRAPGSNDRKNTILEIKVRE
jgi:PPOX class probable F420-dependent enzyme